MKNFSLSILAKCAVLASSAVLAFSTCHAGAQGADPSKRLTRYPARKLASSQNSARVPGGGKYGLPRRYCLQSLIKGAGKLIDAPCIVRPVLDQHVEEGVWHQGLGQPAENRVREVLVESCIVVDSTTLPKGSRIDLVSDAVTGLPATPFKEGQNYFVMAMAPRDGELLQPFWLDPDFNPTRTRTIDQASDREYSLLDAYPTRSASLDHSTDADEALLENLLRVLPSVSGVDRSRLNALLTSFGQSPVHISSEHRWTTLSGSMQKPDWFYWDVNTAIQNASDTELKLRAAQVLMECSYLGGKAVFGTVVMDMANDPGACALPEDLPDLNTYATSAVPESPGFDFARARHLALTAQNERIRRFLLCFYLGTPAKGELPPFIRLLPNEPIYVQDNLLQMLRFATGRWDKQLKRGFVPGEVGTQIVNRQELIEYWLAQASSFGAVPRSATTQTGR
jgi:hypothetical protein